MCFRSLLSSQPKIGSSMAKVRKASHSGSWYSANGQELNSQLTNWLSKADVKQYPARAIIAPHAGYTYCGACGGHAYKQVDPRKVKKVFILGPSHHVRLSGCALTATDTYRTPLYDLKVDHQVNDELYKTGKFETMKISTDEDEHSIEMHLPYIAKVMEGYQGLFTIIPVLVGSLSPDRERDYGRLFSAYLMDPSNLFVISSDFCHWGTRFNYTTYDQNCGEIWKSIKALDKKGMELIERLDPIEFGEYLRQYQNTICGRYPIGILLNAIDVVKNGNSMSFKFLKYEQSSKCVSPNDSSVSYAAGALVIDG